jgi:hypothetical protein
MLPILVLGAETTRTMLKTVKTEHAKANIFFIVFLLVYLFFLLPIVTGLAIFLSELTLQIAYRFEKKL